MRLNFSKLAQYPAPVRLGLFVVTLGLFWLPLAVPIYLLVDDSNLVTILTMALLFGEFLGLLKVWGRFVYGESKLFNQYGLYFSRRNGIDFLNGLSLGLLFTLSLFILEAGLGWVHIQSPQPQIKRIILEGLVSAIGIGLAEEFVFRGWLLDELERDYSAKISLWADALIFATLHFLKPLGEIIRTLPGFPGLLLLGLTLVWAKRQNRRLGLPIGLHGGLVWGYYMINVGKLVEYSGNVSPWITGVDHNPIAGVMGLLFLMVLALCMRARAGKGN